MNTSVKTFQMREIDGDIRVMHMIQNDIDMHCHAFFELVYVLNGTASHHFNGNVTRLKRGDYFIIDPGISHCYRDIDNFEIVNCIFLPEYIDRALKDCPSLAEMLSNRIMRFGVSFSVNTANRLFYDKDGSIGRIIKNILKEYSAKDTGYMEMIRCNLTEILVGAVRETQRQETKIKYHNATVTIADYINKNFATALSLEKLSLLVGYTPQYISMRFKNDTGVSIQTFLQLRRVEEACRLLEKSNRRLNDIALEVGYSDAKHFSKVFSKHKGMSPREYRASIL